jgi:hypothetical protein
VSIRGRPDSPLHHGSYRYWAMTGRWRLLAQVALLGALTFAFPSAGSAFSGAPVTLTPTGPSPAVLTIPVGMYPFWENHDQVTHTVSFANGLCSFQVAPGALGQCQFPLLVGQYPYTVDGAIQASVMVNALPPNTVTLTARSHTLQKAAYLRLQGTYEERWCCGPPLIGRPLRVPIAVLARHDRYHPFRRVATVRLEKPTPYGVYSWRLNLHPKAKTIYIAEVTYQPEGERGQRQAWSRPFRVIVHR